VGRLGLLCGRLTGRLTGVGPTVTVLSRSSHDLTTGRDDGRCHEPSAPLLCAGMVRSARTMLLSPFMPAGDVGSDMPTALCWERDRGHRVSVNDRHRHRARTWVRPEVHGNGRERHHARDDDQRKNDLNGAEQSGDHGRWFAARARLTCPTCRPPVAEASLPPLLTGRLSPECLQLLCKHAIPASERGP
jgi:hypothetical protein